MEQAMMQPGFNSNILNELVSVRMPFGKYKGQILCNIPEPYLVWMSQKGFPPGKLGMLLHTLYEIKLNGLEYLLTPLKQQRF
ncbi:DUF3820 family protein [Alkaliflexus imshenetskii]|uniref:DUF3820 family protein n=1 Tax=Alkaliflexus imshenetskii TaxID=286730 RepID=UPI0004B2CFFC|nr:DUF3820 family protein [Alkaliflexus imshenetskii]